MALVPCKVCGSLNSDQAEICLSCEHPTQGRKRPLIFQVAAVIIVLAFVAPVLLSAISWVKLRFKPSPPQQQERISLDNSIMKQ
ncbi:hypothetical protein Xen7305DRAFT_00013710 [Xenococcus sp. PCC 7305]|uniref:hypothetical protein n=1 Tax=Xenococcus sp. PCC 7305 TaxID=102125 RepID=UPI0002ACC07F|nr:hypothetical protein [Xenococcus sp. PCC 7305]ELS01666.1 hypothetical protein Xen7305DRAFT_00013710 [Xenococcus sp. PCC 7305]